jgi:NitT/TauT family transport system permease protein
MKYLNYLIYVVLGVFILIVWETKSQASGTVRLFISSPSLIKDYFIANQVELFNAVSITLLESTLGLLIAMIFSFSTIILCFFYPRLMGFVLPLMLVSQVIPLITLAPLFIIIFGSGLTANILMAAVLCYFPIFINFSNSAKLINKNILELSYLYNLSTKKKIKHIYFPLSMPGIMAGLKIAATLSVIGAIVAEFSGAQVGLGRNLYISALRTEPELMMSSLILSSVLGFTMYGSIFILEKILGFWYLNEKNE